MRGIRCIKAYNLIGGKFERLEKAFHKLMIESIKTEVILGPIVGLSSSITNCGIFLMIIVDAYLLKNNEVKVNSFVMFLIIGSRVFDPLANAIGSIAFIRYCAVAGKRIEQFLDLPVMEGTTIVKYGPKKKLLSLRMSAFKYVDEQKSTKSKSTKEYDLNNINSEMKQGIMTALVGSSGSGKITILKLYLNSIMLIKVRLLMLERIFPRLIQNYI